MQILYKVVSRQIVQQDKVGHADFWLGRHRWSLYATITNRKVHTQLT